MEKDPQRLTVKEASEYLGVTVPTVYKLLKNGTLDCIKESSRKTLILLEDLENYKNGVVPTEKPSEEPVEESPEEASQPSEEDQQESQIEFKVGDRLRISNIENKSKIIWVINDNKFEPAQVDSEFVGIIENIIQHEGREFVYLVLESGTSKWCILGEQIREGLYPFAEDVAEEVPESSQEAPEEVVDEVDEEDEEEPTEKLKELMKPSKEVSSDFEKLVEEEDKVWQLVKSCDQDLKDYIKENGDGSDSVGYTLELGSRKLTYQPEGTYTTFDWPVALEWFVTNRYIVWKMLKEHKVLTKEFVEKVEKTMKVKEEIKIR